MALDFKQLQVDLRAYLLRGPTSADELIGHLRVSQPTFSRLVSLMRDSLLVVGHARATRYALRRQAMDVGVSVPVFEIDETGRSRRLLVLHAVSPLGFYAEPLAKDAPSGFFDDLPYFMNELRPAGFLGRMIPRHHPELGAPADITHWTADHCLAYAVRYGWNLPGNLIVGDAAFRLYLKHVAQTTESVSRDERTQRYPELAESVLNAGAPGSSAAGEQPKFLSWVQSRADAEPTAVMVKFSPPVADPVGRRVADLLVAEHLAHETMRSNGHAAAQSELITAGGRMFLEITRFDRVGALGRKGVLSFFTLDAQFVGRLQSWSDTASVLRDQGRIDEASWQAVRWQQLFGHMIANTDMHEGNLSVFTVGARIVGLTPTYDMLPAAYSPSLGHIPHPRFGPPLPEASDGTLWESVCEAAHELWRSLASRTDVSTEFRAIAVHNAKLVADQKRLARLLPT